jgi:hypothetical protein
MAFGQGISKAKGRPARGGIAPPAAALRYRGARTGQLLSSMSGHFVRENQIRHWTERGDA